MLSASYPKCANSFAKVLLSDQKLLKNYTSIGRPRPFDVTLRDGLQGLSKEQQNLITTDVKKEMYCNLLMKYAPKNIEIGSCVNPKVLPIFKDTETLFKYSKNILYGNNYILVPNLTQMMNAINFGANNFSFITSVSDSFQFKNTKMNINENLNSISEMLMFLDDYSIMPKNNRPFIPYGIKLYVSCINECPIEGKISNSKILNRLSQLKEFKIDNICLSDTCGTLNVNEFADIICMSRNIGLNVSKFSLHLHIDPNNEKQAEEIFHFAIDNGIVNFDVSELTTGGCSVTMNNNELKPNMSYQQYYKFLTNYLISRV